VINTSTVPVHQCAPTTTNGEISYTMQTMLDKYESLDDNSKNKLFKYAISSGNENLQSRLLLLQQTKSGTSLAKLTKELIKLTDRQPQSYLMTKLSLLRMHNALGITLSTYSFHQEWIPTFNALSNSSNRLATRHWNYYRNNAPTLAARIRVTFTNG